MGSETTAKPVKYYRMLLVADIGNTNVVLGIYDGQVLKAHWRLATDAKTTADEYGILFTNLLASAGFLPAAGVRCDHVQRRADADRHV